MYTFTGQTRSQNVRDMSALYRCFLVVFAVFCSVWAGKICAQHPVWQNFTTTNGLPSNEIYGMMQDSRGYLWFATSQGICRFNGYEFHRPVDTSVAAVGSAFKIAEDPQGRIWFNQLDATLSIIENDTVQPWRYNQVIKAHKIVSFGSFSFEKDGTLWLPLLNLGLLVVKPDGSQQVVPKTEKNVFVFTEVGGRILYSNRFIKAAMPNEEFWTESKDLIFWEHGEGTSWGTLPVLPQTQKMGKQIEVRRLANGDILVCNFQSFYIYRDKQLIWYGKKDILLNHVYIDTDGAIFLANASGPNQGLLRFRSVEHFMVDSFENILPGHAVSNMLRDHEGGWWAATTDAGIFYCKNPGLDILDASNGLSSNQVMRLTTDGVKTVYIGMQSPAIYAIDQPSGHITQMPNLVPTGNTEITTLHFDPLSGRLWCGSALAFLEKKRWTNMQQFIAGRLGNHRLAVKKITKDPLSRIWWASSTYGFYSIDPLKNGAEKIPLDSILSGMRTFSVTPDLEGKLWVTIPEGLRLWQNNRYELPPFQHPALRFPARNVELLPESVGGGMVIALRGGGLLIRDKNGLFTHLTVREGLTSNVMMELDVAPNGVIYAASNTGLNIIRPQLGGIWRIETLTTKHGLPSNQVNDVTWLGDEIWVATDHGIARFRKKPQSAPMPVPIFEKLVVNNQNIGLTDNQQLAHDQNNLSIRFFSIHFRSNSDIPYRYRLLGADTAFAYTRTREVNFANLASGQYTFEVQAQNEDGQWSESSRWPFSILPPWWATWWFRVLVAAALATATYLFYKNRLQSIRREAADREKIRDLETAALRAQMNPHFIFNCLQAIQSFIVQNDRDAATMYLARFAKLVRLALHGSVDGRHTLAEEIAMLDNYLHLEQMRFRGKFEFIITAEGLDLEEISLPPMLVQPFVENALIHGLQSQVKGHLAVVFAQKGNLLEVTVTDNGHGFTEKEQVVLEKGAHKSVGMMLTQKRLNLLSGPGKGITEHLTRKTILDADGGPLGAQVQILIPVM
jgi:ligand-binding sensor domain-containing protein